MTQRLTDDRLQALRLMLQEHAASWLHTIDRDTLAAMLDEIEERRRIDARRLADAEQAFREECEAAAKEPSKLNLPALLRVARAAKKVIDGSEVDGWHTPLREVDVVELREALGELERASP
jgi:hypothetical protein